MESLLLNAAVTLASVAGGLKVAMNGLHKSQERIEQKLGSMGETLDQHGNRLTRLETKLEDYGKT